MIKISWAAILPEKIPPTSVVQSFQGHIEIENQRLARVQSANIRFGNSLARFVEVGRRSPTIYEGPITVTGRIRQAVVTFEMARLLFGYEVGFTGSVTGNPVNPTYVDLDDQTIDDIMAEPISPIYKDSSGVPLTTMPSDKRHWRSNVYPHPVDVALQIDKGDMATLTQTEAEVQSTWLTAKHCLMNGGSLSLRSRGILMTDVDFIGSYLIWKYDDTKP